MGPFLDIHGLKRGRRLSRVSDEARLYYPLILGSTNGYGRLELDYQAVWREIFSAFKSPITEARFWEMMREYRDADLVFLYEYCGQVWAHFHTKDSSLPRYKSKEDERSPAPPLAEFTAWLAHVKEDSGAATSKVFENFPKISENFENFPNVSARIEEELCSRSVEKSSSSVAGDVSTEAPPASTLMVGGVENVISMRSALATEPPKSPPRLTPQHVSATALERDLNDWSKPDRGDIATNLARELHALWPTRCSRSLAETAATQEILKFEDPDEFVSTVQGAFKAQQIEIANGEIKPEDFFPHLHVWFREGEYQQKNAVRRNSKPPDKLAHLRERANGKGRAS